MPLLPRKPARARTRRHAASTTVPSGQYASLAIRPPKNFNSLSGLMTASSAISRFSQHSRLEVEDPSSSQRTFSVRSHICHCVATRQKKCKGKKPTEPSLFARRAWPAVAKNWKRAAGERLAAKRQDAQVGPSSSAAWVTASRRGPVSFGRGRIRGGRG